MKQQQDSVALSIALRKLAQRDSTIFSIKKILSKKKFSNLEIEEAIKYLTERGYLDDEKYAIHFIQRCLDNTKKGPRKILNDLCKKGIPQDISRKFINELYTQEKEIIVMKKLMSALKNKKNKQAIAISLMRRGFRTSTIKEFLAMLQRN